MLHTIISLDYHHRHNYLFISDKKVNTIFRIDSGTNDILPIIEGEGQKPTALAVDWLNDYLYWADGGFNRISVSDFTGNTRRTVHQTEIYTIGAIAIDVFTGQMFWTNFGQTALIEMSALDGTSRASLVDDAEKPVGLTLDPILNVIYWSDVRRGTIESMDYAGQNRRIIIRNLKYPSSLKVFENHIYWTDLLDKQVFSTNRFQQTGPKSVRKVKALNGRRMASILIKHEVVQEAGHFVSGVNFLLAIFSCIFLHKINMYATHIYAAYTLV